MNAREPTRQPMTWPSEVELDDLFDAVANPRRRFVLDQVGSLNENERIAVRDLAEGRAFIETDAETIDDVAKDDRYAVYAALIQSHLPKLDQIGLVHYDDQAKAVARTPATQIAIETVRHALRFRNGAGPAQTNRGGFA